MSGDTPDEAAATTKASFSWTVAGPRRMLGRYIADRAAIMRTVVDRARPLRGGAGTNAAEAIQAVTAQLYYRLVRR